MTRSPQPTDAVGTAGEHHYVVNYDDLEEAVCWRLVERAFVGRVGFVFDGEPFVLPVNGS